jgi:hypothetical protein
MAKAAGFIKRKRKLTADQFLIMLTLGQLSTKHPSLAGLLASVEAMVSREALHQRYTPEATAFMEDCFKKALSQRLQSHKPLSTHLLRHFKRLLIVDSSNWDLHSAVHRLLPGSGGAASPANCKIQIWYDYKHSQLEFGEITPGNRTDTAYTSEIPSRVHPGDLVMFDLGYFCTKTFHLIVKKHAFFVSRLQSATGLYHPESLDRIHLDKILPNTDGNAYELDVILGSNKKTQITCRLICLRVSEETANERRRRVKRSAQKKGYTASKRSLILCDWILMVTNVPKRWLPPQMVRPLYSIRWQIELLFKQAKSVIRIHQSNTKNPHRILCELYGKLTVLVLIYRLFSPINARLWNSQKKELSFDKFFKRIQERALSIIDALLSSLPSALARLNRYLRSITPRCIKYHQKSRLTSLQIIDRGLSLHVEQLPFSCLT